MNYLNTQPTAKNLSILFLLSFILRASFFFFFMQHEERYHQPDSNDYHTCAVILGLTKSFTRPDNNDPIFWRTPGYPLFLLPFYQFQGIKGGDFNANAPAQKQAIWTQIIIVSFIPLILFFLALLLTHSYPIAWITAWLSVFHIGFILASTHLLTDALASFFFYLFLLFFYKNFFIQSKSTNWILNLIIAAASLGLYTWMRPMGKFVTIIATFLLLFTPGSWKEKIKKALLFLTIFFLVLSPWYIRNYQITGELFFCPMSGTYLQIFSAPKIMRKVTGLPLTTCISQLQTEGGKLFLQKQKTAQENGFTKRMTPYLTCSAVAWPWLLKYPFYTAYYWMKEVIKTSFDLYAYQLVAIAHGTFMYDPTEEFLSEKIAKSLYEGTLPFWMRIIAWLELIYLILLWTGLIGGFFFFVIKPFIKKIRLGVYLPTITTVWLMTAPLLGAVIFMTGGFGYARLRIPIEPLMIILSLTFWYTQLIKKRTH